jgi:tetratricopeptide (TPR) repeat protein
VTSVKASPPAAKPPTKLLGPVALDRPVLGRVTEVTALREALEYGGAAAIVKGQGGIGKTTLARAYIDNYRDDYAGVIWLRAEEETTLIEDLLMLAPVLEQAQDASVPKPARARALLDALPAGWLVVYDNAEDDKALSRWLANSPVHVLVTSRHGSWPQRFAEVAPDSLACRTPGDPGPALLMQEAERKDDPEGARDLAEARGGLPLALVAAGGLIREEGGSFAAYGDRLAAILTEVPTGDYPDAVIRAVKLSYDALPEDAQTVLDLFAWFAPEGLEARLLTDGPKCSLPNPQEFWDDIPADVMSLCADLERVAAALRAAVRRSLLRRDGDGYALHRMSAAVLRPLQTQEGQQEGMAQAAAAVLAAGYPGGGSRSPAFSENWPDCARLTPHVLALEAAGAPATAAADYLFNQASIYLRRMAEYVAALRLAEAALERRRARLPDSHRDVAVGYSIVGLARKEAGDAEGAMVAQAESVRLCETYDHGAADLATAYRNHAAALRSVWQTRRDQALLDLARGRDEQALRMREKTFGPQSIEVADSLRSLSELHYILQEMPEALSFSGRALDIQRLLVAQGRLLPQDERLGSTLNDHASLLLRDGQAVAARDLLADALKVLRAAYRRDDHRGVRNTARWLVSTLLVLARGGDAAAEAEAARFCAVFGFDLAKERRFAEQLPDPR